MRRSLEQGDRKFERVDLHRPGFLILEPNGPWIECFVIDVSEGRVCLSVGALRVPQLFGLLLTSDGRVRRAYRKAWRKGELIGARFVTAGELRQGLVECSDS